MEPENSRNKEFVCEEGSRGKLDLLKVQIKILHFLGVFSPENISDSGWLYRLYVTISRWCLLFYAPFYFGMFAAIYKYRDNLSIVTEIIFQMAVTLNAGILATYFSIRRKQLAVLFEALETSFESYIEKVVTPKSKRNIITAVSRRSSFMTRIFMAIFFSVIFGWICVPLILKYTDTSAQEEVQGTPDVNWKHFCIIIWLPEYVYDIYGIVYLIQAIAVFLVVAQYTSCNIIFYFLMFHISTHFELLISCLEVMDSLFKDDSVEAEILNPAMNFSVRVGLHDSRTILSNSHKSRTFDTEMEQEYLNQSPGGFQQLHLTEFEDSIGSTKAASYEDKINRYMTNCIKYHQNILKYCKTVEEFLNPMFLVYFLSSEVVMCLAVFKLSVDDEDGLIKFIVSVGNVCTWPLMICWCGEHLIDRSLALKTAVYGCQWYNHSQQFKKNAVLFILRTQEPVRLTAGKFYAVSLETFANIANTVYAYFTILKRFNDT